VFSPCYKIGKVYRGSIDVLDNDDASYDNESKLSTGNIDSISPVEEAVALERLNASSRLERNKEKRNWNSSSLICKQWSAINCSKLLVLVVIGVVAISFGSVAYYFTRKEEQDNFEKEVRCSFFRRVFAV
jgi:hypothetical protein